MDVSLTSLLKTYQFSTGRYLFALQKVLNQAQAMTGLGEIVAHVQAGLELGAQTRDIEKRYETAQLTPKGNPKLVAIDVRLDRSLVAFRDGLQAYVDAGQDEASDGASDHAREIMRAVYPRGVQAVTQATFVDQLSMVDEVLLLTDKYKQWIGELGLNRHVDRIRKINEEYRAEQQATKADGPNNGDVRAARARIQDHLHEVMALIIGKFPYAKDADVEARQKLLGPILRQQDAIGAYLRSRRTVEDVDPDTGEVQPTTTAPAVAQPVAKPVDGG
jgi:hypothetical protein